MKRFHRPSVMLAAFITVACGVIGLPALPAHGANGITITHTPPPEGIAGDSLNLTADFSFRCDVGFTCAGTEKLFYVAHSGETKVIERSVAVATGSTTSDRWTATVPAADVGFPSARYWFEAQMQTRTGPSMLAANLMSAKAPLLGEYEVRIDNKLRLVVEDANGNNLAGVPVTIWGPKASMFWQTATDGAGRFAFTVPRANDYIAGVAAGTEKQTMLMVKFFTGTEPTAPPPAGTTMDVAGSGAVVAWQVNLGDRRSPPVSFAQDKRVRLTPMTQAYSNQADESSRTSASGGDNKQCEWIVGGGKTCSWREVIQSQWIPVGRNLGGGWDIQGQYDYTWSNNTETTVGVEVDYKGWSEAKGKVMIEDNFESEAVSHLIGPNSAKNFVAIIDHAIDHKYTCGNTGACAHWRNTRATGWGGGVNETAVSTADYFDEACDIASGTCNDYVTHLGLKWTAKVTKAVGVELGFTLTMNNWEFVLLKASTYYSYKDTKKETVTLTFSQVGSKMQYHYLYVPSGAQSGKRPTTDPGWAYTHSSDNGNMQNAIAQDPNAPCVSCTTYINDTGLL